MFDQKTKTVRDYNRSIIKTITTEESFERPHGCWNKNNKNGFIQDIFFEFAATPIVLADVNSCRTYAENEGDVVSEEYFAKMIGRKFRYISLDGKHRTKCISDFLNNEEGSAFTGVTIDLDGNQVSVRNKLFKDLPESVQTKFLNSQICMTVFEDVKKQDLSRIFLGLNEGESLTAQHKRNALQTEMSEWTRSEAKKHVPLFESLFGKRSLSLMKPEQFISKLYVHCTDPKADVGDGALNRLYKDGVNLSWSEAYCGFSSLKTSKILDLMTSINSVHNVPSKKHLCFTLVCESIVNNKMIITDESKFVSEVSKLDSKLEQDSRNKQVQDEKSGPTVKANYYFEQMRLNWNGDYRKRRQSTIWNEIVTQPSVYGIQFPVQNAAK
tara:strand:- start:924 stop:2072 length:1149 start_codon:yes stop_codon:yes gene_type:complete